MQVKVFLRNLRTAPRKSRLVADVIRNKSVPQARALLQFTVKRPADPMLKLLESAVASAVNDLKLEESNLKIKEVRVDEGPKLKRSHPMSRGRAYPIIKRTSHIFITLEEINPTDNKENKKAKTKKAEKPEGTKADASSKKTKKVTVK